MKVRLLIDREAGGIFVATLANVWLVWPQKMSLRSMRHCVLCRVFHTLGFLFVFNPTFRSAPHGAKDMPSASQTLAAR